MVPEQIGPKKSIGTGNRKIWSRKKVTVLEKNWLRKKVPVPEKFLGAVTFCFKPSLIWKVICYIVTILGLFGKSNWKPKKTFLSLLHSRLGAS